MGVGAVGDPYGPPVLWRGSGHGNIATQAHQYAAGAHGAGPPGGPVGAQGFGGSTEVKAHAGGGPVPSVGAG